MGEAFHQVLFGAIVPFALFYVLRERVSLTAAIVAASLWGAGVILWVWRSRGRFDVLTAGSLVFLLCNATLGILSQNATLYLATPSIEQAILATVLVGSVVLRRPAVGLLAAQLSSAPPLVARSEAWRRAFTVVTLAWAAGAAIRIALRLGLLFSFGVEVFLVAYPILSYGLSAGLLAFSFWYPQHVFRRHPPGHSPAPEPAPRLLEADPVAAGD
jgi:hypothetical protein